MGKKENALLIDTQDTVCVAGTELKAGEKVRFWNGNKIEEFCVIENCPIYYKIAVKDMKKGSLVIKYGCRIGVTTQDIYRGQVVHIHNMASTMEE